MSSTQLLRRADLQAKLRISRTTFFEWRKAGKLPAAKQLNNLDVWIESEVDAWLSEQLTAPAE
mgnify:CR=1 FL=1